MNTSGQDWREVLRTTGQMLLFRPVRPDLRRLAPQYLTVGIISAWLAGIGRYWDHPRAEWWQHLGLGSVAYIFVLALVLFLVLWPLRPQNWSYQNVLIFVGLTAPPGILYAVPVERFLPLETARVINFWFLAVVATWRVALLWRFLKGAATLSGMAAFVALLLPLCLIIAALTALNLEKAVFEIMAGLGDNQGTASDSAYAVLVMLTVFSVLGSPILLLIYLTLIWDRQRQRRIERAEGQPGSGVPPLSSPSAAAVAADETAAS